MSNRQVDSVFAAAIALSDDERAELVDRLFFSISPQRQEEIERPWAAEAERRYQAYKDGKIATVDYQDTMLSHRCNRSSQS